MVWARPVEAHCGLCRRFKAVTQKTVLAFDVRGRSSGEAAKGTYKRSLWAAPLDGIVRPLGHFDCHEVSLEMQRAH